MKHLLAILFLIVLTACAAPTTAQTGTDQPTSTPEPPRVTFGYIPQNIPQMPFPMNSPAAFVKAESGLVLEISDITRTSGQLNSYSENIKFPTGDPINLKFSDVALDEKTLTTTFAVSVNGQAAKIPDPNASARPPQTFGFAPALIIASMESLSSPLMAITITCSGSSTENRDFTTVSGLSVVSHYEIKCTNEQTLYSFEFSDYKLDPQLGLQAFTVSTHIGPVAASTEVATSEATPASTSSH
jgi:hypothetical protein